jgi:hypothetical protein
MGEGTPTMTHEPASADGADSAVQVLRSVWAAEATAEGPSRAELEEACGPTKVCRNMKLVSFDGMAEPGSDLRDAWRERLAREGKLNTSGGSIRDLVLGTDSQG